MINDENGQQPAGKCVQCAVFISILKALDIAVDIPQVCSSAPQPDEIDTLLTRKEVMHKLNIKDSAYTRWVEHGLLVPRIMGKRHCYTDDDLGRAFKESMRKGKR